MAYSFKFQSINVICAMRIETAEPTETSRN